MAWSSPTDSQVDNLKSFGAPTDHGALTGRRGRVLDKQARSADLGEYEPRVLDADEGNCSAWAWARWQEEDMWRWEKGEKKKSYCPGSLYLKPAL